MEVRRHAPPGRFLHLHALRLSVELSGATLNPSTHISEQIVVHYDPAEVIHTSLVGTSLSVPRVSML